MTEQTIPMTERPIEDFEITVTRSSGDDGAVVVFIDGNFGADNGVPIRVIVNTEDDPVYAEVEHESNPTGDVAARSIHLTITNDRIAYGDQTIEEL